jgi:hypothetical protein
VTGGLQAGAPARTAPASDDFNPWVTTSSRFLDAEWVFERWNRARTTAMLRIDWRQRLQNGALLTDPGYTALLQAGRELVYLLMTARPDGRRRHRSGSALNLAKHVFAFFRWLIANGYTRLANVDAEATDRYRTWVLARRTCKGRPLAANSTAKCFLVLLDLHRFRHQLSDGLREHPFEGMELDELVGSLAPTGEIPHIPMDVAVPFLLLAVRWVREYGAEIAAALEHCDAAYAEAAAQGRDAKGCGVAAMRSLRQFRFQHPPQVDGQQLPPYLGDQMQLRRLVRFAVIAGFIIIAALTGMRLSELLSLEEDCLEPVSIDDNSGELPAPRARDSREDISDRDGRNDSLGGGHRRGGQPRAGRRRAGTPLDSEAPRAIRRPTSLPRRSAA